MLRDVPAAGWAVVALAAVRALALTVVWLGVARAVDLLVAGQSPVSSWILATVALVVAALAAGGEALVPTSAQPREEAIWRERVARANLAASIDSEVPTGERVAHGGDEVERFAHYRTAFLGPLIAGVVVPLIVLTVIAFAVSWGVALGLAVCTALAPVIIAVFLRRFRATGGRYRAAAGRLSAAFLETMRTRHTIRLLGAEPQRRARLAAQTEALRVEVMALLRRNQLVILVTDAVFGIFAVAVVGVAATVGVYSGWLTLGTGIALVLLSGLLREPVDRLGRSFYVGLAGRASGARVRIAAQLPRTRRDDAARWRLDGVLGDRAPDYDGATVADALLTLDDARVSRGDADPISGLDLVIPAGSLTALVGASGAGKSTLALAMAGLIPAEGIRLGSEPATADGLRGSVAYVPQRAVLFPGTVRDNLLLARATATDDEMRESLLRAGFADEGRELAHGLDTRVGEGASGVSGGQAQRISIARALLTNRPIVIADEATAHLDGAAAARVVATLRDLTRDHTVVMITHRANEAAVADHVAVLAGGRIAPRGAQPAEGGAS
ncbi:ATP-binding cassette domain-containing protein [Microbacterium sp. G2-8]|uniref:ATP-binding cassette domain-containing protein n=1 Tax=Microbacterium sp. G2-8 TaxID=2842454 RepID=UPI001C8AD9B6|nr:ATP-binding cassette domain-containing protein [Microbacterium sp. G2-8]